MYTFWSEVTGKSLDCQIKRQQFVESRLLEEARC